MKELNRKCCIFLVTLLALFVTTKSHSGEFKVAVNSDWPPFSQGQGKAASGILPDLIKTILFKHMGMDAVIIGYPWARTQEMVKQGNLDAMITVPTPTRLGYANSSREVVYTVEIRSITKRGSFAEKTLLSSPEVSTLRTLRYCDILGNGWGDQFTKKHGIVPIIASNVTSCLRMTEKNRVDVLLQSSAVAMREIGAANLVDKLSVLPKTYGKMEFTLLLSKKSTFGSKFLGEFDDAVRSMKADGSYDALINRLNNP